MLTIRPMSGGESYSANYLEQSDYYSEGHKITGQWRGKGAERLGLNGEVVPEDFETVRQGLHPETGEKLRPRMSADRIDEHGRVVGKGRELYDLTFSAPKSVSIMACIGGSQAHGAKLGATDDTDWYGLYIPPAINVLGLEHEEHFVFTTGGKLGGNGRSSFGCRGPSTRKTRPGCGLPIWSSTAISIKAILSLRMALGDRLSSGGMGRALAES